jgi:hypothetical protein
MRRHVRVAVLGQIAVRRTANEPGVARGFEPSACFARGRYLNRLLRLARLMLALTAFASTPTLASAFAAALPSAANAATRPAFTTGSTSAAAAMPASIPPIVEVAAAIGAISAIAPRPAIVAPATVAVAAIRPVAAIESIAIGRLTLKWRRASRVGTSTNVVRIGGRLWSGSARRRGRRTRFIE